MSTQLTSRAKYALQKTMRVLVEVQAERARQDELVTTGKHKFNCAQHVGNLRKLPVLMEEVGEVAKEVYEHDVTPVIEITKRREIKNKLRKELIQTAAVCVAWAEALKEDLAG